MREYYLKKADENLPELTHTKVTPNVPLTVLDKGDELVIDLGIITLATSRLKCGTLRNI